MERMIESRDIKHMACIERIKQLEEENKNLKSDLAYERTMLDNVRAEYESSHGVIKNLKEDVDYFRQCYLDLKKLCEKEGFMLSDDEVSEMSNLDEIK